MKFCEICENLLYAELSKDKNGVVMMCHCCGQANPLATGQSHALSDRALTDAKGEVLYDHYRNPDIFEDPSVPLTTLATCTNKSCPRDKDQEQKVIYIKYDSRNMRYLYGCAYCKQFWTRDS